MRTFIAVELPPPIKEALTQRQEMMRKILRESLAELCRWTRPEQLHLTLRFLGNIDEEQRRLLDREMLDVLSEQMSFRLHLGEPGAFPRMSRPNVLWIGLGGDLLKLVALQSSVEHCVVNIGLQPDNRPYHPHLTLARLGPRVGSREKRAIGARLSGAEFALTEPAVWHVQTVTLMRSVLAPGGAQYTALSTYSL